MLVWFKPLTRHRPAQYAPKRSRAIQGVSHRRKRGVEQRRTPRVMNSLSIWLATGGLPSRAWGLGDFAHPVLLGPVIDFGIGGERFQQTEAVRKVGAASGFGGRVVEVAEVYGAGGAGFDAGRDVIRGVDCGHAVGDGFG